MGVINQLITGGAHIVYMYVYIYIVYTVRLVPSMPLTDSFLFCLAGPFLCAPTVEASWRSSWDPHPKNEQP